MSLTARCHCGATQIELAALPKRAASCNCSFCARTGAVWGYYQPEDMRFVSKDDDKAYSASGGMNQHHFCSTCGMQTWGDSPDWGSVYNLDGTAKEGYSPGSMPTARSYAVNLRLIDDLDWSKVPVEQVDGRSNW